MQPAFRRHSEKLPNNPSPKYSVVSVINTCTLMISYDPNYHLAGRQDKTYQAPFYTSENRVSVK